MESKADRIELLRAFGGKPVVGPKCSFIGQLARPFVAVGELAVDSTAYTLTADSSDVTTAGVRVGSTVRCEGVAYTVRSVQPDGEGMTELVLEQ